MDIALHAVARLRDQFGPVQFHVLGSGPEELSLKDLSRRLDIEDLVTWHGWVDFRLLPRFYSAADSFLFAGRSGGTPRVLLQAMACGAPVVASAIGGIVDHVEHGKNGLLVSVGSSEELAAAAADLLKDAKLAARLGADGARYAHSTVDWEVLVPRIRTEVYSACAARL